MLRVLAAGKIRAIFQVKKCGYQASIYGTLMYMLLLSKRPPTETATCKYYAFKVTQTATLIYFVLLLLCCKNC